MADGYQSETAILSLKGVTAFWENKNGTTADTATSRPATLKDITLDVKRGELLVIVGPVGSSKSSLILAILRELVPAEGAVTGTTKFAYCAQEPWIMSSCVRDNILFGLPFDAKKYQEVIDVCALRSDLALLQNGDMTVIGDRGINLSGQCCC